MKIDAFYAADQTENKQHTQESKNVYLPDGAVRNMTVETYEKQSGSQKSTFDATYQKAGKADIMQDAQNTQDASPTEKMQYVANTMSEKDGQAVEKDGFSLANDDVDTIVTETDKIKIALAKAGVDTSYFGDDVSLDQIEQMAGTTALAMQVANAFEQAGLPATDENVNQTMEAMSTAAAMTPVDDGSMKYLLDQNLTPTVENIYKAEHSGSVAVSVEDSPIDLQALSTAIDHAVEQSGRTDTAQATEDAQWLVANEIPLTNENLQKIQDIRNMKMPLTADTVVHAAIDAVAEGNRPKDAMLVEGYTLIDRANAAAEVIEQTNAEQIEYLQSQGQEVTIENLDALQKQIEAGHVDQAALADGAQQTAQTTQQATQNTVETAQNTTETSQQTAQNTAEITQQTTQNTAEIAAQQSVENTETVTQNEITQEQYNEVKAQRQLEELRLAMSVEANFALLKQGISIETQPLEELVIQLKSIEDDYYQRLLSSAGVEATPENIGRLKETTQAVEALRIIPEYLLGSRIIVDGTLQEVQAEGTALSKALIRAGESYETLMTAPRADLGDSIKKAFRNVDTILEDMDIEQTPENERAVRILGYNSMEITKENIDQVKAADAKVQDCFAQMTPKTVLEMIREGKNPLDMTIDELKETAQQIRSDQDGAEAEKYSKYLWKLEQSGDITEEERSAYIGIYRLLGQIDKTDGAAIGALMNQGAELNMSNLLSAVRTMKHGSVDVSVDEQFGELETVSTSELSISQQIEKGYQTDCARVAYHEASPELLNHTVTEQTWQQMTPEQLLREMRQQESDEQLEQSYQKEQLQQFTKCAEVEESVLQTLEHYDLPRNMYHILAAGSMRSNRNQVFSQLFGADNQSEDPDLEAIKQQILEQFGEAVSTPEDMAKAQQALAETAEHAMETCMDAERSGSLDIRELRQVSAAVTLMGKMAEEENYSIPVLVGDEMTNVSLKIVRGTEEKGKVNIIFSTKFLGDIAAEIHADEDKIQGMIAVKDEHTAAMLQQRTSEISEMISTEQIQAQIDVVSSSELDIQQFYDRANMETQDDIEGGIDQEVQTTQLYTLAKRFLTVIKQLDQG